MAMLLMPSFSHARFFFAPRDGLLQGPGAAAEDITGSASPELTFSAGFDAEWDKGQLLKGERMA